MVDLVIEAGAEVIGDVRYSNLTIAPGSKFSGALQAAGEGARSTAVSQAIIQIAPGPIAPGPTALGPIALGALQPTLPTPDASAARSKTKDIGSLRA